jgi:hypothetical protein
MILNSPAREIEGERNRAEALPKMYQNPIILPKKIKSLALRRAPYKTTQDDF